MQSALSYPISGRTGIKVRFEPPPDEGLKAALAIRSRSRKPGLLVLSQYVEERYAVELIGDDPSGVGYLLKERVADVGHFLGAVKAVAGGDTVLDPEVLAQLIGRRRNADPLDALTPRELQVLARMAEGTSNQAIAEDLVVSLGAVEKHIGSIFAKLGIDASADQHRRVVAVLTYLRSRS
jgi:DNA-binding NarL/FixJ family response regulator